MLPIERQEIFENLKMAGASLLIALLTYIIYLPLVGALRSLAGRALPAELEFVLPAIPWFSLATLFFIAEGIIILISGRNPKWAFFTGFLILVQVLWFLFRG